MCSRRLRGVALVFLIHVLYEYLTCFPVCSLDMSFGGSSQKFSMSGLGFESQQGMGGPGGLMGNEMVMYPTCGNFSS